MNQNIGIEGCRTEWVTVSCWYRGMPAIVEKTVAVVYT